MPVVVAAAMVPVRTSFAATAAALVLVAVNVAIALWGTRLSGMVAALSAALSFDFFLTRPYERLAISHRPDIETTVAIFVIGLIVTEMAARGHHHRDVASEEAEHLALLHQMAEMVATGEPLGAVLARANRDLIELLDLQSCHYQPGAAQRPGAVFDGNGEVIYGGVRWGVATMGLPEEVDLPVQHGGHVLGRFVLEPTDGQQLTLERRMVAVAVADQVGAALAQGSWGPQGTTALWRSRDKRRAHPS
jgi:K+-sensing histidine kinase KdpD